MRIYLIGFMGCGKSYIARNLAPKLDMHFLDLDDAIIEKAGKSIPQIFADEGENVFRQLERTCLQETSTLENIIISTGGGAACFFDNIIWMNAHGTTIFLDVDISIMLERLQRKPEKRPLLANKSANELKKFITQKLANRRAFYEQAHIIHVQKTVEQDRLAELMECIQKNKKKAI